MRLVLRVAKRRKVSPKEAEYLNRLRHGEENPWLIYEVCKVWRPSSLDELLERLPESCVSLECVVDGWEEYWDAYGHALRGQEAMS